MWSPVFQDMSSGGAVDCITPKRHTDRENTGTRQTGQTHTDREFWYGCTG